MHEAEFYRTLGNQQVHCQLCPWNCVLNPGQTGNCKVRVNQNGKLVSRVYNKVAALGIDPIEKKPLYHFYPGKNILSIGEVGCNLHCDFCQNHRISQCMASEFKGFHNITSEKIISEALKTWNNIGIAYTYNEPFTFYEFMIDTAKLAQQKGLKNIVVSNGYINIEPLKKILPFIDAFNIDLKAFNNGFYKKYTKGKLTPVLESLKVIANSKTHLEITNLVIPTLNDNKTEFEEMVKWMASELAPETPLHISRYFPQHKSSIPPTPAETLHVFFETAKKHLPYVYLGNIRDEQGSTTFCPNCNIPLIIRNGYQTEISENLGKGKCDNCSAAIHIIPF